MVNLIGKQKFNPNTTMKSFPLLALEQFERLILSHNVEFRGGFYMNALGANNETREVYVPDSREVFCNTCKALAIVIKPVFSKPTLEKYNLINEELEELKRIFIKKSSPEETIVLGESFYESEKDKILLEEYNNKRVEKYQELFEALSEEFQKKRYWQSATTDD